MSDYIPIRTPFSNMSFAPDVPSNALAPNEYNSGANVETDVRGIRKILGEQYILSSIPGQIIFLDGGYRSQNQWVYIAATKQGKWYLITSGSISNITPGVGANANVSLNSGLVNAGNFVIGTCYTINTIGSTNFAAWGATSNTVGEQFVATGVGAGSGNAYANYSNDTKITSSWVGQVFFVNDQLRPPMYFGQTQTEIYIYDSPPDNYIWNYESSLGVTAVTAGFVRNYSSPNVGNILICGNLNKSFSSGLTVNYPTTVRWSQAFALTGVPASWNPTLSNVANEQEIPVRGPIIDGFFLGGSFYVCSYWDTVVFSPINYQNSTAPIFGTRLFNQGRGLINQNCWTNTDAMVYGIDARDIWQFDGSNFTGIGNQVVKNYFYSNLNQNYVDRMFMVNNTQKYQIEIYYPDANSTGWCNKMLSYRYDLRVWNAPRDVAGACNGCEAPVFNISTSTFGLASRTIVYAIGDLYSQQIVQTGVTNAFCGSIIPCYFERTNIALSTPDGPLPYSSKVYIHRILPEVSGTGTINITVGGANSTAQTPTYGQTGVVSISTDNPWVTTQQNTVRTVALKFGTSDSTDTWQVSAMNIQGTITEDAF